MPVRHSPNGTIPLAPNPGCFKGVWVMSKQCCMPSVGEIGEGVGLAWWVAGVEGKVTVLNTGVPVWRMIKHGQMGGSSRGRSCRPACRRAINYESSPEVELLKLKCFSQIRIGTWRTLPRRSSEVYSALRHF